MPGYAQTVRDLTPPAVWKFGKRSLPWLVRALGGHYTHIRFSGDYPNWEAARRASSGYDAPSILKKTRDALLMVKRGEARWEQDAMVSNSEAMHWPLLACLTRIAAVQGTRSLKVLDFGGSLGSTYFWCKPFFDHDFDLSWHVVEQRGHVEVGRKDLQDESLRFHFTIADSISERPPDVLLMSGVLHFLEDAEAWLEEFRSWNIPHLILDRTPLWERERHRLTVQEVPPEIYAASYPAWFLSRRRIFSLIEKDYVLRWRAPDTETWEIDGEAVPNSLWFFERRR